MVNIWTRRHAGDMHGRWPFAGRPPAICSEKEKPARSPKDDQKRSCTSYCNAKKKHMREKHLRTTTNEALSGDASRLDKAVDAGRRIAAKLGNPAPSPTALNGQHRHAAHCGPLSRNPSTARSRWHGHTLRAILRTDTRTPIDTREIIDLSLCYNTQSFGRPI